MIQCDDIDLKPDDEKAVRRWLDQQAAKTFLTVLKARTQRLQAKAANEAIDGSKEYVQIAEETLRHAVDNDRLTNLLNNFIEGTEPLKLVKLT